MLRDQAKRFGSTLLDVLKLRGWTLRRDTTAGQLLLSARDDADGIFTHAVVTGDWQYA